VLSKIFLESSVLSHSLKLVQMKSWLIDCGRLFERKYTKRRDRLTGT
jgi:hypothetical protein